MGSLFSVLNQNFLFLRIKAVFIRQIEYIIFLSIIYLNKTVIPTSELWTFKTSLTCLDQDEQELGADSDEDISCYDDDFSVGIDLPMAAETSGNVTPIPTTGELEELRSVQLHLM